MELNVRETIKGQFDVRRLMAGALACLLFSSLSLGVFGGQEPSTSEGTNSTGAVHKSGSTIRVHSDLVLIPVTVTDKSGRAVSGLEQKHFTLFEDDAQQKITHFVAEQSPASIGIVFDASDSMAPKLRSARAAVNTILSNVKPNSEFFLVRFSTRAKVLVPMTSRPEEIRDSVERMRVDGSTALLDGVRLAINEMEHAQYSRKAIIIISDGEDNSSHWTVSELKAAVRERDILIYAIGITDPAEREGQWSQLGEALLKEIAKQTGGRLFSVKKVEQLPNIADKIGSLLRNEYVLGYVPSHAAMDGTYRKVQLKVSRPRGYPQLQAVWRQGYYAPKE
jgi:Ca-activated chloride channel homolog